MHAMRQPVAAASMLARASPRSRARPPYSATWTVEELREQMAALGLPTTVAEVKRALHDMHRRGWVSRESWTRDGERIVQWRLT